MEKRVMVRPENECISMVRRRGREGYDLPQRSWARVRRP